VKTPGKYRFGPFEVNPAAREIFKGGTKLKLRGQPYLILEVLLARAGEVVTREEIREKLWPADTFVDFEHGLNTSVKKLRQALCDSVGEPRYIETVPRVGYRLIAPVEVVAEPAKPPATTPEPAPVPVPSEQQPVGSESSRTSPLFWKLSWHSVATAMLLAGVLVVIAVNSPGRMWPLRSSNSAHAARRFSSIAVLPLQNLSADPSQEYFTDGMTDELISDLAQLGTLRVISRTSVMHYKGAGKTVPQIGRELGVDAVIEGTVERVGDRVRIRVQLIDTVGDRHLWARGYDYELKDVLALQGAAAHDIAAEIQGQEIDPPPESHSGIGRAVHADAYEAYLRGRYFWNQRSEEGVQKSIEYFNDAIAKDPTFAAAYAGLADSYSLLGSDVLPAPVAQERARAAAGKAVELDPNAAEGHAELAVVEFYYDWNWSEAEREFQRAVELNPSYATAHQSYSYYLRAMGRLQEALEEAKRAQQLDPLSRSINTTLAGRYRDLHQYDEAIAVNQRTLELDPNFRMAHELMASIFEQQGNFQSAVAEWQKAVELSRDNPSELAALGHAYAISGNQTAARKILEKLQPISKRQYVAEWDMAVLFAGLGDADDAFQCLERSYRERESQMPFLNQDSRLASLRSDPRFHDMLRKVGLLG
jgi:TolB-like protein/DNA-binding winged helix-turn-helix (wHTH) protein/Tfp pilus assembly protein PilF